MNQTSEKYMPQLAMKKDYFDILKDLPRLPERTRLINSFSKNNPVIEDIKTGEHYHLIDGQWRLAN